MHCHQLANRISSETSLRKFVPRLPPGLIWPNSSLWQCPSSHPWWVSQILFLSWNNFLSQASTVQKRIKIIIIKNLRRDALTILFIAKGVSCTEQPSRQTWQCPAVITPLTFQCPFCNGQKMKSVCDIHNIWMEMSICDAKL